MLRIHQLTEGLSVAPQIVETDFHAIAAKGFKSVICSRPDGEEVGQLASADAQAAAEWLGLEYRYMPVAPGQVADEEAGAFAALLEELPGPVLAYCRSGNRSTTLWALGAAGLRGIGPVLEACKAAGYDLSNLRPRLEAAVCAAA